MHTNTAKTGMFQGLIQIRTWNSLGEGRVLVTDMVRLTMKILLVFAALIHVANGLIPGIPDGNDKAYRFVRDKDNYLFIRHVPSPYSMTLPVDVKTPVAVYSEDVEKCTKPFGFTLQAGKYSFQLIYSESVTDGNMKATLVTTLEGQQPSSDDAFVGKFTSNWLGLSQLEHDYTLTVNTKPTPFCNIWLHLRNDVTVTPAPLYKAYVQPTDTSAYFLNSDALPTGFFADANGVALDIMSATQATYTFYKSVGRPIPSIALPTSDCTGLIVHMEINGLCKVSTEVTTSGYSFTIGATNEIIEKRPPKSYMLFTMTDIYVHMSSPLAMRHLGSCSFGPTFQNDAEFHLKISYDKPETTTCSSWPLLFVDEMALRRPPTTTTAIPSTTTAGNATEEAEETTTEAVSSAKTVGIVIGLVVGCLVLGAVVALIVGLITWFKKKKKSKAVNKPVSPSSVVE